MRTHNTGVVRSIHPCVVFKTPLVRTATGNHLMNSTSLEKSQSPVSGFCYGRDGVCNAAPRHTGEPQYIVRCAVGNDQFVYLCGLVPGTVIMKPTLPYQQVAVAGS